MKNSLRFKQYADIPDAVLKYAKKLTSGSPYRQHYHIEPETGFLNDPNGFSFFNGQYHLCYQWSPLRYCENQWYQGWFHLVSDDLVHWRPLGPLIEPNSVYDSHGPYSGSAIVVDDELLIFYTGNTRDENWQRTPYQVIARMDAQGRLTRQLPPAIKGQPEGYTDHFRDPKIWRCGDDFYAVIGAQCDSLEGACVLMHSKDGSAWQIQGELKVDVTPRGYMWECPDYFEQDGQGVLIYCPQGLCQDKTRRNLYEVHYLCGEPLSLSELTFAHRAPQLLDNGFDMYATQTMMTPDGRRILIGWMGVSQMHYPTEAYGHCGILSIPREISVRNGCLYQQPLPELQSLRGERQQQWLTLTPERRVALNSGTAFEARITFNGQISEQIVISLRADESGKRRTTLTLDAAEGEIIVDRSDAGEPVNAEYGVRRITPWSFVSPTTVTIFSDTTSLEIFIDDGAFVSSSRIFPRDDQRWLMIESHGATIATEVECWTLKGMNHDGNALAAGEPARCRDQC